MRTIMNRLSRMDDIDVEGRRVLLRTDFNVPPRQRRAAHTRPWPMTPESAPRATSRECGVDPSVARPSRTIIQSA